MATVSTLRSMFRSWTGRPGLSDSDVDVFLNAGQRLLDLRLPASGGKARAKYFTKVGAGAVGAKMQSCRYVYSVYSIGSEGREELDKIGQGEMMELYNDTDPDQGTPEYYAPWILRPYPDSLSAASLTDYLGDIEDYVVTDNAGYTGIMFYPPADATYTLEIIGGFFTPELSDSNTETHWSINHPLLVVQAAMVEYEQSLRNKSAADEWLALVDAKLLEIGRDQIEEELADVDDIEG